MTLFLFTKCMKRVKYTRLMDDIYIFLLLFHLHWHRSWHLEYRA